jgi:hypothetical protein
VQNATTLETRVVRVGDELTLTCSGSAEGEALDTLGSTLKRLHEDAIAGDPVRVVKADIRALEFASSSCLKEFVKWLQVVKELDEPRRYQICFQSNPAHSWQRRSLSVFAVLAAEVVRIETVAS